MKTIRRMATAIGAAFVLAGIPATAAATEDPAESPECAGQLFHTDPITNEYGKSWTYTFVASWCVVDARITGADVKVTHQEHDATCTWRGPEEQWAKPNPEGGPDWIAFDKSVYSCKNDNSAEPRAVNPWAKVFVYPTGHYDGGNGIAQ